MNQLLKAKTYLNIKNDLDFLEYKMDQERNMKIQDIYDFLKKKEEKKEKRKERDRIHSRLYYQLHKEKKKEYARNYYHNKIRESK